MCNKNHFLRAYRNSRLTNDVFTIVYMTLSVCLILILAILCLFLSISSQNKFDQSVGRAGSLRSSVPSAICLSEQSTPPFYRIGFALKNSAASLTSNCRERGYSDLNGHRGLTRGLRM